MFIVSLFALVIRTDRILEVFWSQSRVIRCHFSRNLLAFLCRDTSYWRLQVTALDRDICKGLFSRFFSLWPKQNLNLKRSLFITEQCCYIRRQRTFIQSRYRLFGNHFLTSAIFERQPIHTHLCKLEFFINGVSCISLTADQWRVKYNISTTLFHRTYTSTFSSRQKDRQFNWPTDMNTFKIVLTFVKLFARTAFC